jgi:hypothetical protein
LPFVSPFSNHSTVTLRESKLMPLTTAEWILPVKVKQSTKTMLSVGLSYLVPEKLSFGQISW